jgi:hypothetical protein
MNKNKINDKIEESQKKNICCLCNNCTNSSKWVNTYDIPNTNQRYIGNKKENIFTPNNYLTFKICDKCRVNIARKINRKEEINSNNNKTKKKMKNVIEKEELIIEEKEEVEKEEEDDLEVDDENDKNYEKEKTPLTATPNNNKINFDINLTEESISLFDKKDYKFFIVNSENLINEFNKKIVCEKCGQECNTLNRIIKNEGVISLELLCNCKKTSKILRSCSENFETTKSFVISGLTIGNYKIKLRITTRKHL